MSDGEITPEQMVKKPGRGFHWGFWCLTLFLIAFVAAIAIPGLLRSRIGAGESSAQGSLKSITTGQEQFKSGNYIDLDKNKIGEYGFLEELGGVMPVRVMKEDGKVAPEGVCLQASPYIPRVLGTMQGFAGRKMFRASKAGYHFILYLPTGMSSATSVHGDKVDTRLAEMYYIAYAWPQKAFRGGDMRVFVIDPQGQPYFMANTGPNPYIGDDAPPWDAALKESSWDSHIDDGGKGQACKENWTPTG